MDRLGALASRIEDLAAQKDRSIVAIAGPPGSGKSTLAVRLCRDLNSRSTAAHAMTVPMDGFHFDNAVLEQRGLLARKGAPETFDCPGYRHALERIRGGSDDVAIPIFDREMDVARAGAAIVHARNRIILTEGNYLLLERAPWSGLQGLFDLTIFLIVDMAILENRLVARWLDHGLDEPAARQRATSNDLPNARLVIENSCAADMTLASDESGFQTG